MIVIERLVLQDQQSINGGIVNIGLEIFDKQSLEIGVLKSQVSNRRAVAKRDTKISVPFLFSAHSLNENKQNFYLYNLIKLGDKRELIIHQY